MDKLMKEMIKQRKSVRTFTDEKLKEEDIKSINEYISAVENPFGVPVTFRLLSAEEYGLSSPVVVGAEYYIAAKVKKVPNYELAYGYCFEKVCLFAASKGLGTVILAATLSRSAFEAAMELSADEVMPAASPIGYPAQKRSIRETMMRKGLKADERMPFEKLFFNGSFENSLDKAEAGSFAEALEAVRWAPSATNKQPWRAVADGDKIHFYEAKTLKDSTLGDIQKVDIGIALANFELIMQDSVQGLFVFNEPQITKPDNMHYIVTFEL